MIIKIKKEKIEKRKKPLNSFNVVFFLIVIVHLTCRITTSLENVLGVFLDLGAVL